MDENQNQQESTQSQKSNLNPLLIVVILIIVAAVGVMLWLGSNKTGTQSGTQVTPTESVMQETPTETATDESAMQQAITVEGGEFFFKPNVIRVKQGEKVTITLKNGGKMPHDFIVDEFNVQSEQITGGQTTVIFTPDKKGSFEFYCSVGNHRQMGMKGTLIVE